MGEAHTTILISNLNRRIIVEAHANNLNSLTNHEDQVIVSLNCMPPGVFHQQHK